MKTTKRFLNIMMASLVGVAFCSCSSDDDALTSGQGATAVPTAKIYTMTVEAQKTADGTRALELVGSTLKSTWTAGDKVEVWTSDGTTKKYGELSAESAGASTKLSGTLDELPTDGESLMLKYLSPAYNSQKGTIASISDNCDYSTATVTATVNDGSVTTTNAAFANQQAVIQFTLKNADGSASLGKPTAFSMSDGTSTVSLTDIPAATYTDPKNGDGVLYVAFPGLNTSATITLYATVGGVVYSVEKTSITFTNGKYYGATVKMKELAVFTVNAGKQVVFAKGNLRYVSGTWSFFEHQYDYYTTYSETAWDKFGWSTSATTYGMNTSTYATDYSGAFVDWGDNTDLQSQLGTGWRTLTGGSDGEWNYVFNERTTTSGFRYAKATVNGVSGVILLPDNWSSSYYTLSSTNKIDAVFTSNIITESNWTSKLEANGAVFLPAAGYRYGTAVDGVNDNYGYYWSSTDNDASSARIVTFSPYTLRDYYDFRNSGISVRLVREVE